MRTALALLATTAAAVTACGGTAVKRDPPPTPRVPLEPALFVGTTGAPTVATATDLLAAARANDRAQAGGVERITEVRWGEHTFGRAVIDEAVAVRAHDYYPEAVADPEPTRQSFEAHHGVAFDQFWRVLLEGYSEQLERRYGVVVDTIGATSAKALPGHAIALVASGALPEPGGDGEYAVTWRAGQFELSGLGAARPRTRADIPAEPGEDRTLVTVVLRHHGSYYAYPAFNWTQLRLRVTGDAPTGNETFAGKVRRAHAERIGYVTEAGRTFERVVAMDRWTPYMTLRPGRDSSIGLKNDIHLVRVTLDGSALPQSAVMTESLTVLDGTDDHPLDLQTVYRELSQKFDWARRGAEAKLEADIDAIEARFEKASKKWAADVVKPEGRFESSPRDYMRIHPSFSWNDTDATLSITFSYEHHVIREDRYHYPNPALETFDCPPGAPCAIPPRELTTGQDQTYVVRYRATYVIDRRGEVVSETASDPTVHTE